MEDREIVDLYWQRDERAIKETETKYARYLMTIALNILRDEGDGQECVNDTYLRAWNSMPEARPSMLSTYLGKITRNLAIDIYRKDTAAKRGDSQYAVSLEELAESAPGAIPGSADQAEEQFAAKELAGAISEFLKTRPAKNRNIFISRYFFMDEPKEIAGHAGMNEATVRSIIHKARTPKCHIPARQAGNRAKMTMNMMPRISSGE